MNTDIQISMTFKKSTKNTHVFEASTKLLPPAVPTLYISKLSMNKAPEKIIVTIKGEDNAKG